MRRGTIIVVVFIVLVVAVIAASQFFRSQVPLELTIAVSPLAEDWIQDAVTALNATEPVIAATRRIRFTVVPIDDMAVWQDESRSGWTPEQHPVAWIPAASMSVDYAEENRLPFEIVRDSVAKTPLMWGGFASRVSIVTGDGAQPFDWDAVQAAADEESWQQLGGEPGWGFVKLAFDQPSRSVSGFGVLLSAAAESADTAAITPEITNGADFRNWFIPVAGSVASFNTLGADAAAAMASRGASVAEIGLLPENRWLTNLEGLTRSETVQLHYPAYTFVFDFPVAQWNDATTTSDQREAVTLLANWLSAPAQQASAAEYGLRPISGVVTEEATLFNNAVAYGVQLTPAFGDPIAPLPRSEAQRLLQWFSTAR